MGRPRTNLSQRVLNGISRDAVLEHPHVLGHLLGYPKLTETHSDWIKYIWLAEDSVSLQAHRQSYKTTAIIVVGVIWYLLFNPNSRVLIVRKEDNNAKAILGEIAKHYRGDVMRALYANFYGIKDFRLVEDRSNRITLPTKLKPTKEGSIECCGIETSITGRHYERIHTDDIITIKDRISRAQREATKIFVSELENVIEFGGTISHTGTPWHKDDAWKLLPPPKKYPLGSIEIADLTQAVVDKIRSKVPPSIFSINFLLEHMADEGSIFRDPVMGEHPVALAYSAQVDAGYGGKDTTALTIMAVVPGEKSAPKIYARGWVWHKSVEDLYDLISLIYREYGVGTMYEETNSDKGLSAKEFRRLGIHVADYQERENKHIKIVANLYRHWRNIVWHPGTEIEYLSQIVEYKEGQEPDDAPDSAASLLRKLAPRETSAIPNEEFTDPDIGYLYDDKGRNNPFSLRGNRAGLRY